jgi:hypothetical protein
MVDWIRRGGREKGEKGEKGERGERGVDDTGRDRGGRGGGGKGDGKERGGASKNEDILTLATVGQGLRRPMATSGGGGGGGGSGGGVGGNAGEDGAEGDGDDKGDEGDKGEGRLLTLPGGLVVEMAEGSEGDREARAELQYIHREIFEEGV